MEVREAILTRRSIRHYRQIVISEEDKKRILQAGLAGPSAANARPICFIAIDDKKQIEALAKTNRYGKVIAEAMFVVAVVADLTLAIESCPDYWVIDGAIAGQNMILAAKERAIGSCWIGQYPQEEKMTITQTFFNLPESIRVHSIITFGYPKEALEPNQYDEPEKIHYNQW